MKYTVFNPSAPEAREAGVALNLGGSDDIYGANSIQIFSDGSLPLGATHADAQGFLDWYGRWNRGNFWFKDAGAQVWGYEETYDNWQDTYGMDAVRVFYHSGHGGMDNNGVFYAPLGAKWSGRDVAVSSNMIIGNEELRYLFWSTCQSLKVPDIVLMNPTRKGPIDTWKPGTINRGLRMIFGFHSNSLDSPHYGRNFGNNWNAGQNFSDAWINASWAISHRHICTVCAMGANANEAKDRLFNERLFFGGAASTAWYWWRWSGWENPVLGTVAPTMPEKFKVLEFAPTAFDEARLSRLAGVFGFTKKQAETLALGRDGSMAVLAKTKQLTVDTEGRMQAVLAPINHRNPKALEREKAVELAEKLVADAGFRGDGVELKFDSIRVGMAQGGSSQGSGIIEKAYQCDTTVIFRQTAEGLASINAGHGLVMVTLDNDGTVTHVHNSTRPVVNVSTKPKMLVNGPKTESDYAPMSELRLNQEFTQRLSQATGTVFNVSRANNPLGAKEIESTVGYDFSGQFGTVVANREYEVAAGGQFEKRYKIRVPIFA